MAVGSKDRVERSHLEPPHNQLLEVRRRHVVVATSFELTVGCAWEHAGTTSRVLRVAGGIVWLPTVGTYVSCPVVHPAHPSLQPFETPLIKPSINIERTSTLKK